MAVVIRITLPDEVHRKLTEIGEGEDKSVEDLVLDITKKYCASGGTVPTRQPGAAPMAPRPTAAAPVPAQRPTSGAQMRPAQNPFAAFHQPAAPAGQAVPRFVDMTKEPKAKGTVLIADDDMRIRLVYKQKLEKEGFRIQEATTGDEAWAIVDKQGINLMIMDLKMPGMHGFDVLRNMMDRKMKIPVIVCTAFEEMKDEFVIKAYPKLEYLVKPAPPHKLLEVVNKLLGIQSAV